jgi:hypothetical protein
MLHHIVRDQYLKEGCDMTCAKCKGLMVQERQPAVSSSTIILRCLNCGLIIDPLIEQNRSNHMRAKAA